MRRLLFRVVALVVIVAASFGVAPGRCSGAGCNKCSNECQTMATKTCIPAVATKECKCNTSICWTAICAVE